MLATALVARFYCIGVIQDLDEAILLHQEASSLRPGPHPDRLTTSRLSLRSQDSPRLVSLRYEVVSLLSVASNLGLPLGRVLTTESHVRSTVRAVELSSVFATSNLLFL